jgi:cytochrome b involved in lipid metabolism
MNQPRTLAPTVNSPVFDAVANKDAVVAVHVEKPLDSSTTQHAEITEKTVVPIKDIVNDEAAAVKSAGASSHEPLRRFTMKDVAAHNTPNDIWMVIDNEVYNVTDFREEHPGGAKSTSSPLGSLFGCPNVAPTNTECPHLVVLNGVAGKDATKKFDKYHRRALLELHKPKLRIGVLDEEEAMNKSRRGFLSKIGLGRR